MRPAPGVEAFPGAVAADAPRVTRRLTVAAGPGWRSTGLYVPAGEVVRLVRVGAGAPWTVRVGCHTDRLWAQPRWSRWPEVAGRWTLDADELRVASLVRGLALPRARPRQRRADRRGHGRGRGADGRPHRPREHCRLARAAPGARALAELHARHLSLTVPSASIRALDDPAPILRFWDRVLACYAELGQRPLPARAERFVADVQLSPAATCTRATRSDSTFDVATPQGGRPPLVLDLERLEREGSWGHFHELGHNHQQRAWTFAGTTEVTCNLFTLYVMDTVVGIEPWEHPWLASGRTKVADYLAQGAPYPRWTREPDLALAFYAEVQRAFGWAPFQAAFRAYREQGLDPATDAEKRDRWLLELSRAVGRDLGPHFERWGIPTSAEARAQLRDLPPWQPE
ncbi:MAG: M60 family metallopeptidase [Planctomycetota bacterium]